MTTNQIRETVEQFKRRGGKIETLTAGSTPTGNFIEPRQNRQEKPVGQREIIDDYLPSTRQKRKVSL